MRLVYNRNYKELLGYFKDGRESSLEYDKYVKHLYQNRDLNWIAQVLVQYFEDFLDPTPEELTLFELEFGKEVLDFVFLNNNSVLIRKEGLVWCT